MELGVPEYSEQSYSIRNPVCSCALPDKRLLGSIDIPQKLKCLPSMLQFTHNNNKTKKRTLSVKYSLVIPSLRRQRQVGLWACWSASLAVLAIFRSVRDLVLKNKMDSVLWNDS